jgi:HK97 family phage major capsid protein
MNKKLEKILRAKKAKRADLVKRSNESEDVKELRSINGELQSLNDEIAELQIVTDESEETGTIDQTEDRTAAVNNQAAKPEERSKAGNKQYVPGEGGFTSRSTSELGGNDETAEKEKRGKLLKEGRSVTVEAGNILLPERQSSTINETFNAISGLIDSVTRMPIMGGNTFKQAYEIGYGTGGYTEEGADAVTSETVFGYATISKAKITAYNELTNEVSKLPAADYDGTVTRNTTKALRKQITREILIGDGSTEHLTGIFSSSATALDVAKDKSLSGITNTTLSEIVFSYGGDEDVEDMSMLILNKADLKAFSQLRTTDGKQFHTIKTMGNTGTIDGVPYIINSACKALTDIATAAGAYCMAYGPLSAYTLAIFSDIDIQRSTDFKFKAGMICNRGEIFVGGNVTIYNGFLRVKKAAAV